MQAPAQPLKLLLFSHMYPRPEYPVLGCFVENQARALYEHAHFQVAVVNGVPFGLSFQNPGKLLKSLWRYFKALKQTRWEEQEGAPPVLRVPFCINRQWLPFPVRAICYMLALLLVSRQLLRYGKPDVLHAHTAYLDGSAARLFATLWKRSYWITEHNLDAPGPYATYHGHPLTQTITRWALARATGVIAVSQALKTALQTFTGEPASLATGKMHYLPNSVDTELFYPDTRTCTKPEGPFRVMFVGSLDPNKNPLLLLEMMETVDEGDLSLTLIGQGPLQPQLEQRLADSPVLQQRVMLLPNQPRAQLARLMREKCDVLVLPSVQETFGVVLIEAMACGKPVIATRCGGPESIVTAPWLGELIAVGDVNALLQALTNIRNNPGFYASARIRAEAVAHYSNAVVAARLKQLYGVE